MSICRLSCTKFNRLHVASDRDKCYIHGVYPYWCLSLPFRPYCTTILAANLMKFRYFRHMPPERVCEQEEYAIFFTNPEDVL